MGEQRSTASGPMASKASDSLLCTLLLCVGLCVVGCWVGHGEREEGRTGKSQRDVEKVRRALYLCPRMPWDGLLRGKYCNFWQLPLL